ncbi:alpha-N-arabinofuranosidase, partial [Micromonospora sp. DH15]|nr:alpha-N-arabinofuranosidase [Micromonospora sp. DH15]
MFRPHPLLGLAAAALVATTVATAAPGLARTPAPKPEYTITVDPAAAGTPISDSMYGVFFEDINFAADGGLYAELVHNRSFEFGPADNRSYTPLTGWTPTADAGGAGTASTADDAARLHERNRTYLRLDLANPRDTFRQRPNGLRRDLAEKIAALKPGFVRFPGGCLVNTGSMSGYDAASNWPRARSYQWKDTVGPVETRATNANFWGYNQSYGLGYYEYFQFAEDIGAMPLPVVPALVTGCGQNQATVDEALLQRHIADTLDLIEFANGPTSSTWGRLRASMGHPRPFGLTHLAVGNEENLPDAYFANFQRFRTAIEAAHPGITVIGNSGPDDAGGTFDRLWQLNRDAGVAMVDEHYYNSPAWFLQNNTRYDSYDRDYRDITGDPLYDPNRHTRVQRLYW